MANDVEICNLALTRLGVATIASINDKLRQGIVLKDFYNLSRDAALREHDWQFARRRKPAALLPDVYDGWDLAYAYPADCLAVREIFNPAKRVTGKLIEFEIGLGNDSNTVVIMTNQPEARLIYTAKVVNSVVFDALFVDALAWRLAADLVQPLTGSDSKQGNYLNFYNHAASKATAGGMNEQYEEPSMSSDFSRARN